MFYRLFTLKLHLRSVYTVACGLHFYAHKVCATIVLSYAFCFFSHAVGFLVACSQISNASIFCFILKKTARSQNLAACKKKTERMRRNSNAGENNA
jgi:hypothetical protein